MSIKKTSAIGFGVTFVVTLVVFLFLFQLQSLLSDIDNFLVFYNSAILFLIVLYFMIGFIFGKRKSFLRWMYPFFTGIIWLVSLSIFFNALFSTALSVLISFIQCLIPALMGISLGVIIRKTRKAVIHELR